MSFHASGLAELKSEIGKPCPSGKDVVVTFLHPFQLMVCCEWRMLSEIELLEVDEGVYDYRESEFSKIEKLLDG